MVVWDSADVEFDAVRGEIIVTSRHRVDEAQHLLKSGSNLSKCVGAVSILFVQPEQQDADKFTANQGKSCVSLPSSLSVVPSPAFTTPINNHSYPPATSHDSEDVPQDNSSVKSFQTLPHSKIESKLKDGLVDLQNRTQVDDENSENSGYIQIQLGDESDENSSHVMSDQNGDGFYHLQNQATESYTPKLKRRKCAMKTSLITSDGKNKCRYCKKVLNSWQDTVDHAIKDHGMKSGLSDEVACPICKDLFDMRNMTEFIRHVKGHNQRWQATSHLENSSDNITFQSLTSDSLPKNMDQELDKCEFIDDLQIDEKSNEYFENSETLSQKKKFPRLNPRVSQTKMLKCDVCKKSIACYNDIVHHSKIHDMFRECPICRKSFTMRGGVLRHFVTHVDNRVYTCHTCNSVFTRKDNLKRHKERGCQSSPNDDCHVEDEVNNDTTPSGYKSSSTLKPVSPIQKLAIKFNHLKRFKPTPKLSATRSLLKEKNIDPDKEDDEDTEDGGFPVTDIKSEQDFRSNSVTSHQDGVFTAVKDVSYTNESQRSSPSASLQNEIGVHSPSQNHTRYSRSPMDEEDSTSQGQRSGMNYACGGCNVTFASSSELRKHVVLVHSEGQEGGQEDGYFDEGQGHLDERAAESDLHFDIKPEIDPVTGVGYSADDAMSMKAEYEDLYPDDVYSQNKIVTHSRQQLEGMDVIDIESLGMFAEMDKNKNAPDIESSIRRQHSSWVDVSPGSSGYSNRQPDICVYPLPGSPQYGADDSSCNTSDFQTHEDADIMEKTGGLLSTTADSYDNNISITPRKRKNHLQDTAPICQFCGLLFDKAIDIVHHTQEHMDQVKTRSTCTICVKDLSGKDSFLRHANSHIGRLFPCEICYQQFSRKDNLKRHRIKVHDIDTPIVENFVIPDMSDS